MEPALEPTPKKQSGKLTFRAVLYGVIVALIAETLFILLALAIGKYESEAAYLYLEKMWWLVTGLLSFFLGRYVTAKISGVKLKRIFKWEEEKEK